MSYTPHPTISKRRAILTIVIMIAVLDLLQWCLYNFIRTVWESVT